MNINEETVLEMLPHGSGIDCKWEVEEFKPSILCKNSYHVMDENGYYDGYIDFSVRIPKHEPLDFEVHFATSSGRTHAKDLGLVEYLEDTIFWSIKNWMEIKK
jgi:hypothetical protein